MAILARELKIDWSKIAFGKDLERKTCSHGEKFPAGGLLA